MPKIVCKKLKFFSPGDERQFFTWLESINGVRKIEGVSDEIHIHTRSSLSGKSKHELWAILNRYNTPAAQLKRFGLIPDYGRKWRAT